MNNTYGLVLAMILQLSGIHGFAENIDPYNTGAQYGWSENTGWLNLEPSVGSGVQVSDDKLLGWIWGENIGWINLSCENTDYCGTVEFGVVNDGNGNLSGLAWGENVGWINFDPVVPGETKANEYRVRIDSDGTFSGWAWGENIGWIHFDGTAAWSAQACVVTLEDLEHFADYWLQSGSVPGELDGQAGVKMGDFSVFAHYWLTFCPDGWKLK